MQLQMGADPRSACRVEASARGFTTAACCCLEASAAGAPRGRGGPTHPTLHSKTGWSAAPSHTCPFRVHGDRWESQRHLGANQPVKTATGRSVRERPPPLPAGAGYGRRPSPWPPSPAEVFICSACLLQHPTVLRREAGRRICR